MSYRFTVIHKIRVAKKRYYKRYCATVTLLRIWISYVSHTLSYSKPSCGFTRFEYRQIRIPRGFPNGWNRINLFQCMCVCTRCHLRWSDAVIVQFAWINVESTAQHRTAIHSQKLGFELVSIQYTCDLKQNFSPYARSPPTFIDSSSKFWVMYSSFKSDICLV